MKTITVRLGARDYSIHPLPMRKAREWRKRLEVPFSELVSALENADSIELTDLSSVARVVQTFAGTLIDSIDILMDLLFAYAPELAADRERIEDEAYDEEALAAFVEVLKLAYPFGIIRGLVTGSGTTPDET